MKKLLPYLLPVITYYFNRILTTSAFPTNWKTAKVIPIPKKNPIKSISDLRPISLLPILSKVLEVLMREQIVSFLSINSMLTQYQSGFRENHSTHTALIKVCDDIAKNLDAGNVGALVLLDFSKAKFNFNFTI